MQKYEGFRTGRLLETVTNADYTDLEVSLKLHMLLLKQYYYCLSLLINQCPSKRINIDIASVDAIVSNYKHDQSMNQIRKKYSILRYKFS